MTSWETEPAGPVDAGVPDATAPGSPETDATEPAADPPGIASPAEADVGEAADESVAADATVEPGPDAAADTRCSHGHGSRTEAADKSALGISATMRYSP
jgi:hypothetical protein